MIAKAYLIVTGDGEMRIRKTPTLDRHEVAFRLTVKIPDTWARVVGNVDIDMPEPPAPEILVEFT